MKEFSKSPYGLAVLSAVLLWLSWPPLPYTGVILLVAFMPLLWGIEKVIRSDTSKKGKKIFLVSGVTAILWNTSCIYWVYNSISEVMPVYAAIPISMIPFGLAALLMALAFRAYYELRKYTSIYISLVGFAGCWIAYEYLHQSWDLAFPWMTLGNGFASTIDLIQWYEFTGVYGGTVWILLINALGFLVFLAKKDGLTKEVKRNLSIALDFCLFVPVLVSLYIFNTYEEKVNPSEVVVVQPNIEPYAKFGTIPPEAQIDQLIELSESVALPNTEFIIWPETAIAHSFGYDEDTFRSHPVFYKLQNFLTNYKNASLVSGIESFKIYQEPLTLTAREWDGVFYDHFNAVVLTENSAELQFYHKSKLVPGVEKLPFGTALSFMKPLFKAFGGTTGGYGSQDEPSVLYAQSGIGVAPVICYESIWGNYVGKYVQQGAQFISIVTNDGWWGNTSGKDQHFDYARLRAVETRRWVARAANTGISGFINQRGDVIQKTEWWVPAAQRQEINLNEELTFYVRHGDYIAYLFILIGIAALIFVLFRRFASRK
jgi:apolipoprotein N-acyltransferase